MADELDTDNDIDAEASFIESFAAKYEKQDRESGNTTEAKEDGDTGDESVVDDDVEDVDDEEEDTDAEETGAGDEEHTDEGTSSDDSDGKSPESKKDSAKGKAADHTEDDESEESDPKAKPGDDDEATEEDEGAGAGTDEGEEDETRLSAAFEEAAARLSIPLTLEDVPEGPARQLVQQKILSMDRAFTRTMQAQTAYRKEEVAFRADAEFRRANPEMVMVELLRSFTDPTEQSAFIDRVNERLDKLGDPDQAKAFEIVVKDARKEAVAAIERKNAELEHRDSRIHHVTTLSHRLAAKAGVPPEFVEQAVALALFAKPEDKRDLTDEEVIEIAKETAKNYGGHMRAHRREEKKSTLKDRLANKKTTPGSKTPSSAASPKPTSPKRKPIDYDNEDERHAAMMGTARKLFPGARDE